MITDRSKNIVNLLPHYNIEKEELLKVIEQCVCQYYSVTPAQLKGKDRTSPIPSAKRLYLMFVLELTGMTYKTLGKKIHQSHCMVVLAKKTLLELDDPWNKELLEDYNEINYSIEQAIRLKFKPKVEKKTLPPDERLLSILSTVRLTVDESVNDTSMRWAKEKFLDVIILWKEIEKLGAGNEVRAALEKIKAQTVQFPLNPAECFQNPVNVSY